VHHCTAAIAENQLAFNAYTEFFLHIDHICFFLQSEVFQIKADASMHMLKDSTDGATRSLQALSHNAQQVSLDLQESVSLQFDILDAQEDLATSMGRLKEDNIEHIEWTRGSFQEISTLSGIYFAKQEEIVALQHLLNEEQASLRSLQSDTHSRVTGILEQTGNVQSTLDTLSRTQREAFRSASHDLEHIAGQSKKTMETLLSNHREMDTANKKVRETLEQISSIQKTLATEFFDIHTLTFYVVTVVLAYLLTSATRTSSARVWIFLSLTLMFAFERMLVTGHFNFRGYSSATLDGLSLQVWVLRRVFLSISCLTLMWFAYTHRDYTRMNFALLCRLNENTGRIYDLVMQAAKQKTLSD